MKQRNITEEENDYYQERAAVMEYEGELTREEAERRAWAEMEDKFRTVEYHKTK